MTNELQFPPSPTYRLDLPYRGYRELTSSKGDYLGKLLPGHADRVVKALKLLDMAEAAGFSDAQELARFIQEAEENR